MNEIAALTWRQYRLERRLFWRNPSAALFNFLFPLILLGLFGAVFSGHQKDLNVIVPGIAGMSVMSTTFTALAVNNTALQVAIITVAGRAFFGIPWPREWPELILFVAAGVICFASLGVALS